MGSSTPRALLAQLLLLVVVVHARSQAVWMGEVTWVSPNRHSVTRVTQLHPYLEPRRRKVQVLLPWMLMASVLKVGGGL